MKLLNGSEIAGFVKERQAKQVRNLRQSWRIVPRLAVVQLKDDPVIDTYVRLKRAYADDILIEFELHRPSADEVHASMHALNAREDVHGIIVQLPLPQGMHADEILQRVSPEKDVDGLGANPKFDPATPLAINWLLAAYNIDIVQARIAIVGTGRLVGGPLLRMWQESGYDVHAYTEGDDLAKLKECDVIVTATGVPGLITNDMVGQNAVVVDAGTAAEHGVIKGDVTEEVRARKDITITPLRGGVGPLTVAALYDNVILAARRVAEEQGQKDLA